MGLYLEQSLPRTSVGSGQCHQTQGAGWEYVSWYNYRPSRFHSHFTKVVGAIVGSRTKGDTKAHGGYSYSGNFVRASEDDLEWLDHPRRGVSSMNDILLISLSCIFTFCFSFSDTKH